MAVSDVDNDMTHLYPPFATKVALTLYQVRNETKGKYAGIEGWVLFEGYRSQARQNWLYAQGRTRPGAVVTHKQVSNHTSGLAADIYPIDIHGEILWNYEGGAWEALGHCARSQGLQWGGDYPKLTGGTFVDQPHIEPPLWQRILWRIPAFLYLKKLGV